MREVADCRYCTVRLYNHHPPTLLSPGVLLTEQGTGGCRYRPCQQHRSVPVFTMLDDRVHAQGKRKLGQDY